VQFVPIIIQPTVLSTYKSVAYVPTAPVVIVANPVFVAGVITLVPELVRATTITVNICPGVPFASVFTVPTEASTVSEMTEYAVDITVTALEDIVPAPPKEVPAVS
jgi:hypothetical protein